MSASAKVLRNPTRVLFILTQALNPTSGGVQMSTVKIGRWLASRGLEVAVFSFAAVGHQTQAFCRLYAAEHPGNSRSERNLAQLSQVLADFRPDVVINQMPYEHEIGEVLLAQKKYLLLACLRNTLFSVKNNLDDYANSLLPAFLRPVAHNFIGRSALLKLHKVRHRRDLRRILQFYDHFIMFGPPNIDELKYFVGEFEPNKIRLIPNSIPRVAKTVPEKEKRLLWLGRVAHAQKQAGLIPEVWKRVAEGLPDWQLDIVGDGPALEEVKEKVRIQGLERVFFHGRQIPDDFFSRASIFFMTSAFEGFPNTLVEAQSYGTVPVIFDSYPVARWLIKDGCNGFLIPPFDVEKMSSKIVEVGRVRQDDLAHQCLESASEFSIDSVGQQWLKLFSEYRLPSAAEPE